MKSSSCLDVRCALAGCWLALLLAGGAAGSGELRARSQLSS